VVGIAALVGGFFVGYFHADVNIGAHLISALFVFFGGAVAVGLFSIAIFRTKELKLGRVPLIVGLIVWACFVVYLIVSFSGPRIVNMANLGPSIAALRPKPFWADPFFEWLPLIGVFVWIFLLAVQLLRMDKYK
jgi:hypothetical protein